MAKKREKKRAVSMTQGNCGYKDIDRDIPGYLSFEDLFEHMRERSNHSMVVLGKGVATNGTGRFLNLRGSKTSKDKKSRSKARLSLATAD